MRQKQQNLQLLDILACNSANMHLLQLETIVHKKCLRDFKKMV